MVLSVHHLVGAQEIETMLRVSRQRVQQLIKSDGWPEPEVVLGMGKVWQRATIEKWARDHGRTIYDEEAPA
jgi:hypothetical protein